MRQILVLALLFSVLGCGIKPSGEPGSKGNSDATSQDLAVAIDVKFREMQRPFSEQDFGSQKFFLDYRSVHEDRVYLMSPEGTSWVASTGSIDTVEKVQVNATFKSHVRSWLTEGNYLWRLDLNDLMRTDAPVDIDSVDEKTTNISGYKIQTTTDELGEDGKLRVIGVAKDHLVVKTDTELVDYKVSEDSLTRVVIPTPEGMENWAEAKIQAYGDCRDQKCFWFIGEEKTYVYIPNDLRDPYKAGEWLQYGSRYTFDGGWESFVSISMVLDLNEDKTPKLEGPIFVTTSQGIHISELGFDSVFTSREFVAGTTYTWENTVDIARDYCIECHTGFLGLEDEKNWLDRKDIILKYILVEGKDQDYTMPKKGSKQAGLMRDDERRILQAWLESKGADASRVNNTNNNGGDGGTVRQFSLQPDLQAFIAVGGPGNCLQCHGSGEDNMNLRSWWTTYNVRGTQPGRDSAVPSVTSGRMPVGGTLSQTQQEEFERLVGELIRDFNL